MSQPPVPPADPFVPPEKGHALELVLGAVVGGVDVVITGVLGLVFSANIANGAWGFAPLVVGLLVPLVLLLNESTRWWGVGILIGYFLTLIVLGGACVALIASFSG
jgi:hypothetical protein